MWNKRTNNSENWNFFLRADSIPRSRGLPSIWHLKLHRTAGFTPYKVLGPALFILLDKVSVTVSEQLNPVSVPWVYFLKLQMYFWALEMSPPKRKEVTLGHEFTATSWRESEKGVTLQDNLMGFAAYWVGHPSPGFPRQLISKPTASRLWSRQTRWGCWCCNSSPKETRRKQGRQAAALELNTENSLKNIKEKSLTKPQT